MNKHNETVGLLIDALIESEALDLTTHEYRPLAADEIDAINGGRMASTTTCSCGCADDCGL